jgi:hypothetical protein
MIQRILFTGILAAALAFAQRGGGGGGSDMGEGMGGMGGGGGSRGGGVPLPSAGGSRPSRLDQFTTVLKLNKDQKKETRSILDEAQKQATPLRDQIVKGRTAIGDAIQAGKSQDEIDQLAKSEAALDAQLAGIELGAFSKIFKLLDKDQQPNTRTVFIMMRGIFNGKNWNTEE